MKIVFSFVSVCVILLLLASGCTGITTQQNSENTGNAPGIPAGDQDNKSVDENFEGLTDSLKMSVVGIRKVPQVPATIRTPDKTAVKKPDTFQTVKPLTCPGTEVYCEESCVDLQNNVSNCGACGRVCYGYKNDRPYCWQGKCTAECLPGYRYCEDTTPNVWFDTPGCVPVQGDPEHCGSCDKKCYPGETCENERCVPPVCTGVGETVCKGQCVNFENDPRNCGSCGKDCQVYMGTGVTCDAGQCVLQSCDSSQGYEKCHDTDTTCTNLWGHDGGNCGSCGHECGYGYHCSSGICSKNT